MKMRYAPSSVNSLKIVALAGGVGGAKLAHGLSQILPPENLTIIVNTGDDFEHYGLFISPDLDTVCYTLAGLSNPVTGWGRMDESWQAITNAKRLGGPAWFNLGDQDLGTHLERTRRLRAGQTLSQITFDFCKAWDIHPTVLPMSDQPVHTIVDTIEHGELAFQEYFVNRGCEPTVKGFRFEGVENAVPPQGALDALNVSDAVIICPSNPWVSIDPILCVLPVPRTKSVVAVSPIIDGKTIKGPAAKMYADLGIPPSALAVAQHYREILSGFVLDKIDTNLVDKIGIPALTTDTLMKTLKERARLAQDVLNFIWRINQ